MSNTIQKLNERGQSIWCDDLSREMINSGELQRYFEMGVTGVTSNPTIFMKALSGGDAYDELFNKLASEGKTGMELYEGLVLPDIADAADMLRPVYDRTDGRDGFVSLEVNPKLAYDMERTLDEARRLFKTLNRPNVLIKVPATDEGIPAIETLIGEGINVNVTLIFSLAMYRRVMGAYSSGLKKLDAAGGDLSRVASVASFFVSRLDTLVDKLLAEKHPPHADISDLLGAAAVANTRLAYALFEQTFRDGGDFAALAAKGARVQRPLWASTSTKNPEYPPTKYVDDLVGPDTVNTIPPDTIAAVLHGGRTEVTIRHDLAGARAVFAALEKSGIHVDAATDKLSVDGVKAFSQSFDDLLANLEAKHERVRAAG
ncbi:MAG: transaldolase [Phycisphaerae bacterium]